MFASEKVRQIWVPYPSDEDEYSKMVKLYEIAEKYGVKTFIYKDGDSIHLLDKTIIEAYRTEIERSAVPISLISIRTVTDRVVYASPAFNESDLADQAELFFDKSNYVIFGNKGPVSKTRYTIENDDRLEAIIFADDLRLALFESESYYHVGFMTVKDKIDIYIDK